MRTGEKLTSIYGVLLKRYGDRHWWPAETPFETMVGAILTQNVSWKNAAMAISNLRDNGMLSPERIRGVPVGNLAALIRPACFMNLKARRLKAFVEWYSSEFSADIGEMSKVETRDLRRMLLGVEGVGEETADCILLYACGRPVFVVDAYTRRVFGRLGLVEGSPSYGKLQTFFMENLPNDAGLFKDYHAQLVHLAKDTCRKEPECGACPLRSISGALNCEHGSRWDTAKDHAR